MKAYGRVDVYLHIVLTLEVSGQASCPGRFTPGERAHQYPFDRAGLDDVEKRKFLTLRVLNSDPSVVQP
jgi:hypothetical protein